MRIPIIQTREDEIIFGKKRQGRSKETRLLIQLKKTQEYWQKQSILRQNKQNDHRNGNVCGNCGSTYLEFDPHMGDTSCTECGEVVNHGPFIVNIPDSDGMVSRYAGYSRTVYFNEKIAQLCGDGPWIYNEDFELIERAVERIRDEAGLSLDTLYEIVYPDPVVRVTTHPREKYLALGEFFEMFGWTDPIQRYGRSDFTRIAKDVGLAHKKYGERFMQIRLRLGLEDDLPNGGMSKLFRNQLKYRMFAYEQARKQLEEQLGGPLRNIAVNYLIVQFIIMEDKAAWENRWIRYIHVTSDQSKLDEYNETWAYIIRYLKLKFRNLILEKSERSIRLYWKYKKLTLFDLYHKNKLPR